MAMKRLQIYIERGTDAALSAEASRRGTSKAALVREAVGAYLDRDADDGWSALRELVGTVESDPEEDIDEVVYEA